MKRYGLAHLSPALAQHGFTSMHDMRSFSMAKHGWVITDTVTLTTEESETFAEMVGEIHANARRRGLSVAHDEDKSSQHMSQQPRMSLSTDALAIL